MASFKEILEDWRELGNELGDAYAHNRLFWSSILSRSIPAVGKSTAETNVSTMNRYKGFFQTTEDALGYALVLSVNILFDLPSKRGNHQPNSIFVFLNKLGDQRKKGEFKVLRKKFKTTIDQFGVARNEYFAHRHVKTTDIPSIEDTKQLLDALGAFLNSIGDKFTPRFQLTWHEGVDDIEADFNSLLKDLQ